MPTFMELQKRLKRQDRLNIRFGSEEMLVIDARGKMRPGEFVDQKLRAAQNVEPSNSNGTGPAQSLQN